MTVHGLVISYVGNQRTTEDYISFRISAYNPTDTSIWIDAGLLSTDYNHGGLWLGDGHDRDDLPMGSAYYSSEITPQEVEPVYDYFLLDHITIYYTG